MLKPTQTGAGISAFACHVTGRHGELLSLGHFGRDELSHQAHRVHVHGEGDVFGEFHAFEELREDFAHARHLARAEHELIAIESFRAQQRRGRGAGRTGRVTGQGA